MPEIIRCPSCQRKLRLPDGPRPRLVQCPTCGVTFEPVVEPVEPVPAALPADAPPVPPPERPSFVTAVPPASARPRACDFCNQPIRAETVRCPFCGEFLDHDRSADDLRGDRPSERDVGSRRDRGPSRATTVLVLGITSIAAAAIGCAPVGLPLGVIGWVTGRAELRRIDEQTVEPEGHDFAYAGWVCSVVGTGLSAACGLVWVLWAVAAAGMAVNGNPNGP